MTRLTLLRLLATASLVAVPACSGGAAGPVTFSEAPLASMPSESGDLTIEIRTWPAQPPPRGLDAVEYRITGKDGAPVDGLQIDVLPWMPAMGHGASVSPSVTATGDGRYRIDDVDFFMPGQWVLHTSIAGGSTDGVVPEFQIP
jgi:ABC-type glycerol-3-phosphate transport system substrate-binding protein